MMAKKTKVKEAKIIDVDKKHKKCVKCGGAMSIAMFNSLVCKNKSCENYGLEFMDMGMI